MSKKNTEDEPEIFIIDSFGRLVVKCEKQLQNILGGNSLIVPDISINKKDNTSHPPSNHGCKNVVCW